MADLSPMMKQYFQIKVFIIGGNSNILLDKTGNLLLVYSILCVNYL